MSELISLNLANKSENVQDAVKSAAIDWINAAVIEVANGDGSVSFYF